MSLPGMQIDIVLSWALFENKVIRRMFVPKKDEGTEPENYIMGL
jgi:hypothetical protein